MTGGEQVFDGRREQHGLGGEVVELGAAGHASGLAFQISLEADLAKVDIE